MTQNASPELPLTGCTVLVGPNGAGKTLRLQQLLRAHPSQEIRYVPFKDRYGGTTDPSYYHQQRWQAGEAWDPRVRLSSGELRKYQLDKYLQQKPRVLVIDNPFIGLDAASRAAFRDRLREITREGETGLVLAVAREKEIPDFATAVIRLPDPISSDPEGERKSGPTDVFPTPERPRQEDAGQERAASVDAPGLAASESVTSGPAAGEPVAPALVPDDPVVEFRNVALRYGGTTILGPLDLCIRQGDRWALTGPNGSGKSALLSLICADNPQAYACDIRLFGRRRGSGESIWDIKSRISYMSPEAHRAFKENVPVGRIVAGGVRAEAYLYGHPDEEAWRKAACWMDAFGIGSLAGRPFRRSPTGNNGLPCSPGPSPAKANS